LGAATKTLFVVPNFVALTKPFFFREASNNLQVEKKEKKGGLRGKTGIDHVHRFSTLIRNDTLSVVYR